jgi:S1-C subfamily serine protease
METTTIRSCLRSVSLILIAVCAAALAQSARSIVGSAMEILGLIRSARGQSGRALPAAEAPRRLAVPVASVVAPLESSPGIRRIDEYSYEIDRAVVERQGGVAEGTHSARIVPEVRDGAVVGFRLYSVQPGGLLAQLGIRNGDLLRRLNDRAFGSPEKALEAYGQLKAARDLKLELTRDDRQITLRYHII